VVTITPTGVNAVAVKSRTEAPGHGFAA